MVDGMHRSTTPQFKTATHLHTSSTLRDYIMWAWPNDSTRAVRRSVARTGPALSLLTMPDAFISCGCFLVGGLGGGCVDGGKKNGGGDDVGIVGGDGGDVGCRGGDGSAQLRTIETLDAGE